jgi:hypothetical protein
MSRNIKIYIKTYETCQRREKTRFEEPLFSTIFNNLWTKIELDVIHMPSCEKKHFLIITRDDFSN